MADRYWVGGDGLWGDPARWSATSGGAGGASVPTSADNAYFDANSDAGTAFTAIVGSGSVCKDLIIGDGVTATALDQNMGLFVNNPLDVFGSLFLPATRLTFSGNQPLRFASTTTGNTITTNGRTLPNAWFTGVGGAWTLGSALTVGSTNTIINAGTINTNNFSFTAFNISINGGTFNAGSSVINVTTAFVASAGTFNAGTSVINLFATTPSAFAFSGGGNTFYEVAVPGGNFNGVPGLLVTGANTFTNFRIDPQTVSNACRVVQFAADQTITGTFTAKLGVTSFTDRILFSSNVRGVPRTITAAAVAFGNGADFTDIVAAGASAPWNLASISAGNGGNNTNITFPAPKTVYRNGTGDWTANAWATTPTGTPAAANYPLIQDTAVFTEAGIAGTLNFPRFCGVGNLIFDDGISPRTSAVTIRNSPYIYGDVKLSSGVLFGTDNATIPWLFTGAGTQNVTFANKSLIIDVVVEKPVGSSVVLLDNVTIAGVRSLFLNQGTVDINNKVLSLGNLTSSNSNVRSIAFGATGKIEMPASSQTLLEMITATNFTCSGSRQIDLTFAGTGGIRRLNYDPSATDAAKMFNIRVVSGFDTITVFTGAFVLGPTGNYASASQFNNLVFEDAFGGVFGVSADNSQNSPPVIYGDLRLSPNMTLNVKTDGTRAWLFKGTGTQTITSSGRTFPVSLAKEGSGTLRLLDNLTVAPTFAVQHAAGTLDLNNKILTVNGYAASYIAARSLVFGSGEMVLNGTGTLWNTSFADFMTVVPGTGKIFITDSSATGKTFAGGGIQTFPEVVIQGGASTSTITFTGANRFERITNARTSAYTVVFPGGTTTFNSWGLNGSEGALVSINGSNGTINYAPGGTFIVQFVSLTNSIAVPNNRSYAVKSVNGGGNIGWIFGAPAFGKFLSFFAFD